MSDQEKLIDAITQLLPGASFEELVCVYSFLRAPGKERAEA